MIHKAPPVADLHVHSSASDGILAPGDLVRKARESGLTALALTDHDTLGGVAEAMQVGQALDMRIIPGIELSCGWPDREVSLHVLGLFVSLEADSLCQVLLEQQRNRFTRAFRILDRLEAIGIATAPLRAEFEADPDRVLGRPHVARFLVAEGLVGTSQEAFARYLGRGRPAYEPKLHILPELGIEAIHRAGGVAIIAHPGLLPDWNDVWRRVQDLPWDGIEVFYSEHTPTQVASFLQIAQERNWLVSGGSDFHGDPAKEANFLGRSGLSAAHFQALLEGVAARKDSVRP